METRHHIIAYLLLTVSLMMLMMPVVPHHHHDNGTPICLKADFPAVCGCHWGQCGNAHANCNENRVTRIQALTPAPTQHPDDVPCHPHLLSLPHIFIGLYSLFLQRERQYHTPYQEPLYGTCHARTFALRGPPSR